MFRNLHLRRRIGTPSNMDLRAVVSRNGGIIRVRQLVTLGATRREVAASIRAGHLFRIRIGVLACDDSSPVAIAGAHGGALTCVSALRARGVWVLDDAKQVHVALGANGRAHPHDDCRCVVHRDGKTWALGIVSVRSALVQVSRCMSREVFFAALESAMNLGLVNSADLAWIHSRVTVRARILVRLARWDAESGLESILRLRLWLLGFSLRSQVYIHGVGRVDFLVRNLIIEADGRQNHEGSTLRSKDLRRDAAAIAKGYRVIRLDYSLIIHQWPLAKQALLAALR